MNWVIIVLGCIVLEIAWVGYVQTVTAQKKYYAVFWCSVIASTSLIVAKVALLDVTPWIGITVCTVAHAAGTWLQLTWCEWRKK